MPVPANWEELASQIPSTTLDSTPLDTPALAAPPGWRSGQIDPAELQGGGGGMPWYLQMLGGMNPWARAAIAAGGVLQPTPTAANDTISPEMAGQRPEYPRTPTPGGAYPSPTQQVIHPAAVPGGSSRIIDMTQPQHPSTMRYPTGSPAAAYTPSAPVAGPLAASAAMPARPVTPTPPGVYTGNVPLPPRRPQNLGVSPRAAAAAVTAAPASSMFTTLPAPNADPLGRNRPTGTALDLSGLFRRS